MTVKSPLFIRREDPDAAWRLAEQLHQAGALDTTVVVNLDSAGRKLLFIAEEDVRLRRVYLIRSSNYPLLRNPSVRFGVSVCLMEEGYDRVEYLGEWDLGSRGLAVNQPERLTGEADIDQKVRKGQSVWISVVLTGDIDISGLAVQAVYGPEGV